MSRIESRRLDKDIYKSETPHKAAIYIETDYYEYMPASVEQVQNIEDIVQNLSEKINTLFPIMENIAKEDVSSDYIRYKRPVLSPQEEKFKKLLHQWREDTQFSSTIFEIATHPAYQQIIGMGTSAVPLILRELAKEPDHWFWALKAITSDDPVPEQDRGDIIKMTEAWLNWASKNGYNY